jgi:hypothetical protein
MTLYRDKRAEKHGIGLIPSLFWYMADSRRDLALDGNVQAYSLTP